MADDNRTVLGACPHDCPDTFSMVVTVKDGQVASVAGNPDHPFTDGCCMGPTPPGGLQRMAI